MRLLASVRGHYQWLRGRRKAHRFSLFIHRRELGDPLTGRSIDDIFMTYSSFLHPPAPYSPTVLRKAFCTHLVHRKLNIAAIQVLMGHEKCETTLHYYVQLSPEQLEQTWKETNPYAHRV